MGAHRKQEWALCFFGQMTHAKKFPHFGHCPVAKLVFIITAFHGSPRQSVTVFRVH